MRTAQRRITLKVPVRWAAFVPESKRKAPSRLPCATHSHTGTVDDGINGGKFLDGRINASFDRSFVGDVDFGKKTTIGPISSTYQRRLGVEIKDNNIATVGKMRRATACPIPDAPPVATAALPEISCFPLFSLFSSDKSNDTMGVFTGGLDRDPLSYGLSPGNCHEVP